MPNFQLKSTPSEKFFVILYTCTNNLQETIGGMYTKPAISSVNDLRGLLKELTLHSLVTSYGDTDLCQHCHVMLA